MAMEKALNLRIGPEELAAVEREQARLAAQGVKISLSQAARTLMMRGSTVTNIPNGGSSVEIADTFQKVK